MKWSHAAHKLWRCLSQYDLKNKKILIAFSGGADSMALVELLLELREACQWTLELAHIHHGDGSNQSFRTKAQDFAHSQAQKWNLPYHMIKNLNADLNSEEDLRHFRYQELRKIKTQIQADWIATAHHQDDLLETRLLFLIRGVGAEKLVSMRTIEKDLFRPLLEFTKTELVECLQEKKQMWVEDPSNQNSQYLRNWLRHEWLPQLENQRPGSLQSLSRSLELLLPEAVDYKNILDDRGIKTSLFNEMSQSEKKELLSHYIRGLGYRKLSHGLVEEILKRLDKNQIHLTFTIGSLNIQANAQRILLNIVRGTPSC